MNETQAAELLVILAGIKSSLQYLGIIGGVAILFGLAGLFRK